MHGIGMLHTQSHEHHYIYVSTWFVFVYTSYVYMLLRLIAVDPPIASRSLAQEEMLHSPTNVCVTAIIPPKTCTALMHGYLGQPQEDVSIGDHFGPPGLLGIFRR